MSGIFKGILAWYMANMNYGTIILLMAIESSFIPLPSEVVIPPAAWKAAEGDLNLYLVMLAGTIGSVIGATFNYFFALYLGRNLIYKLANSKAARMIFINEEKVKKSEEFFLKYGKPATFIGRLVPGVRHLISIPAGLSKMNFKDFILYTFLGSAIWNIILAYMGYFLYSQKDNLEKYYKELAYGMVALGVIFVGYYVVKAYRKKASIKV